VWAPIFSDLLIHKMPVVNVERLSPRPRDPWSIARQGTSGIVPSFDISRNLADDTFSDQKAAADGREFRTAPLMGIGRIGPPFMHDARVYLSSLTVNSAPASTVTTNSTVTNAPLVIQTADDALLAVIEMHDLPAPDNGHTSSAAGGGCPVPANGATNISYGVGATGSLAVCPPYNNSVSRKNRSDSREVIRRFRSLSPADQQAIIAFLKQL
jgi:hypothetical protein